MQHKKNHNFLPLIPILEIQRAKLTRIIFPFNEMNTCWAKMAINKKSGIHLKLQTCFQQTFGPQFLSPFPHKKISYTSLFWVFFDTFPHQSQHGCLVDIYVRKFPCQVFSWLPGPHYQFSDWTCWWTDSLFLQKWGKFWKQTIPLLEPLPFKVDNVKRISNWLHSWWLLYQDDSKFTNDSLHFVN